MTVYATRQSIRRIFAAGHRLAISALVLVTLFPCSALHGQEGPGTTNGPGPTTEQGSGGPSNEIYVSPSARNRVEVFARSDIRDRIDRLWTNRKALILDSAEAESGPESLKAIQETLQVQGFRSVAGMEANLVYEARLMMGRKHFERARQSLLASLSLDPAHLPALSGQAEISLRRNPTKVPGHLFSALTALGDSFLPALTALTNLALVLLLTLLIVSCIIHLVLVFRYQKRFRHSIEEGWRERLPGSLVAVFGWCLLLLPLFLFLGPFWLFSFWTALLWRFANRAERLLAVLSLVFLALLTPAANTVVDTYCDLGNGDLHLFSEALQHKLLSPRGESLLLEAADQTSPGEPLEYSWERQFLVGSIQQRMGRNDDAFERYASVPMHHYLYSGAQNNIGNIYFSMNQFDLASQHYRKAINVHPGYAECYFNLSSAQFQVYDFDQSDKSLSRAQRLAPLAIGKLIYEESRGLKTLDHHLPVSFLWDLAGRALRINASRHFSWLGLGRPAVDKDPGRSTTLILLAAALAAMLAGFLISWIHRHENISICRSCGRAWCRLCGPDPLKEESCQQCVHLGSRMSGVSPEIRTRKLRQLQRHTLWRNIRAGALALCMPGVEAVRHGRTIFGLALATTWFFLITILVTLPHFLPRIGLRAASWSINPMMLTVGALAALLWLSSVLHWVVKSLKHGLWRPWNTVRSDVENS